MQTRRKFLEVYIGNFSARLYREKDTGCSLLLVSTITSIETYLVVMPNYWNDVGLWNFTLLYFDLLVNTPTIFSTLAWQSNYWFSITYIILLTVWKCELLNSQSECSYFRVLMIKQTKTTLRSAIFRMKWDEARTSADI